MSGVAQEQIPPTMKLPLRNFIEYQTFDISI